MSLSGTAPLGAAVSDMVTAACGSASPRTEGVRAATAISKSVADIGMTASTYWNQAEAFVPTLRAAGHVSLDLDAQGRILSSNTPRGGGTVPRTAMGTPDFEAIERQGGTVQGAIPPNNLSSVTIVSDSTTVYYAAQVTLPGRSDPVFVRGVSLARTDSPEPPTGERTAIATALKYAGRLPSTLPTLPWPASQNLFDIHYGDRPAVDVEL